MTIIQCINCKVKFQVSDDIVRKEVAKARTKNLRAKAKCSKCGTLFCIFADDIPECIEDMPDTLPPATENSDINIPSKDNNNVKDNASSTDDYIAVSDFRGGQNRLGEDSSFEKIISNDKYHPPVEPQIKDPVDISDGLQESIKGSLDNLSPVIQNSDSEVPSKDNSIPDESVRPNSFELLPTFEQGMEYYAKKDYTKSAAIWAVLADIGDNNALFHLALLYKEGLGVRQNIKIYFELLFKASEQGHSGAKDMLEGNLSTNVKMDSNNESHSLLSLAQNAIVETIPQHNLPIEPEILKLAKKYHETPTQGNSKEDDVPTQIATHQQKISHVDYNKLVIACISNNSSNLSKREKQEFGKIRTVYRALTGIGKKDSITSLYIRGLSPNIHPTHISVIRRYLPLLMPYLPQNVVQNLTQKSENIGLISGDAIPNFATLMAIEDILLHHELPMRQSEIVVKLQGQFTESDVDVALKKSNRFIGIGDDYYDLTDRWQTTSCEALLIRLPQPFCEFASYLISKNKCSYKPVLALLFMCEMDKNGCMDLLVLKNRFYDFYLSRITDGKIVESKNLVISNIDGFTKSVVIRAMIEPLKSFTNSSFFVIENNIIKLKSDMTTYCNNDELKASLKIVLLKYIDYYYNMLVSDENITVDFGQENQTSNAEIELMRSKMDDEVIIVKNIKKKKIIL